MTRTELFQSALDQTARLAERHPGSRALRSIIEQLSYLIEVESSANPDRSRIADLNIGVLASREVEDLDEQLAALLHSVASEARSAR